MVSMRSSQRKCGAITQSLVVVVIASCLEIELAMKRPTLTST